MNLEFLRDCLVIVNYRKPRFYRYIAATSLSMQRLPCPNSPRMLFLHSSFSPASIGRISYSRCVDLTRLRFLIWSSSHSLFLLPANVRR